MGRRVEGGVKVTGGLAPVKIAISGRLYPKRRVSFIEELARLARHYGLKVKAPRGPKGRSRKKKGKKK